MLPSETYVVIDKQENKVVSVHSAIDLASISMDEHNKKDNKLMQIRPPFKVARYEIMMLDKFIDFLSLPFYAN